MLDRPTTVGNNEDMGMSFESYSNPPHKLQVGDKYVDAGGMLWRVVDERHLTREGGDREIPFLYRAADEAWGPLRRVLGISVDSTSAGALTRLRDYAERMAREAVNDDFHAERNEEDTDEYEGRIRAYRDMADAITREIAGAASVGAVGVSEDQLSSVRSNDWDDFCLEASAAGIVDSVGYGKLMALNPFD